MHFQDAAKVAAETFRVAGTAPARLTSVNSKNSGNSSISSINVSKKPSPSFQQCLQAKVCWSWNHGKACHHGPEEKSRRHQCPYDGGEHAAVANGCVGKHT